MIATIGLFGLAALVVPALGRLLGPRVFLVAALVPAAAFVGTLAVGPAVAESALVEHVDWVPQLGLGLTTRLDSLSWFAALIVTGVGAAVVFYCARYFHAGDEIVGRFAGIFLAFAGAMYGLVVADDVYLLFVFWEATSVFSYLLIGHEGSRAASRRAALQALLVTTLGGLAMLVGLVLLAHAAGTTRISEIVAAPPTESAFLTTAIVLILVGALSKSAIFPFHFWLPGAMAAPTPVSAYLHAAAMVKGGIVLVLRFAPGFAESPGWRELLVGLGLATMLLGGWNALRQHDLKLLLAHSTVSQLGFLLVIAGYGAAATAPAALALLLAHALYKSTLFLVVGIVDHRVGTRDLRELSGLGRRAPVLAATAALALLGMAGAPPVVGFVAKEAVLAGLLHEADALAVVAVVGVSAGSALAVAAAVRFYWGAFARKRGVDDVPPRTGDAAFLVAPAALALAGLVLGPAASIVDAPARAYAATFPAGAPDEHLALWHGFEPPLAISAATLLVGGLLGLFVARTGLEPARMIAAPAYRRILTALDVGAARLTALTQRGSLPFYLGVIFTVLVTATAAALAASGTGPAMPRLWDDPTELAIGAAIVVAAIAATLSTRRFQAVVLVGVTGFGMSAVFALHGAPDLALTQLLVETITLTAFVLVLRRLPARLGERNGSTHRVLRAVIALAVGGVMATVAALALGVRIDAPVSERWPELAVELGHGRNVVNVALVDIRAWDTLGELSVIIAAATGIASLVFISGRTDDLPRVRRRAARDSVRERWRASRRQGSDVRAAWLVAGRTLAPRNRSILLEVVVRLLFHALIVVSLYLLFAGHNAPGGGFAGGLVAGLALLARYLAGGRVELGAAAPLDAGVVLGLGLLTVGGAAGVPLLFGAPALTSTWWEADLWLLGHVEFVTSTVFDLGVYLIVVGLVLDVLRSLGAEVDRQAERRSDASGAEVRA